MYDFSDQSITLFLSFFLSIYLHELRKGIYANDNGFAWSNSVELV